MLRLSNTYIVGICLCSLGLLLHGWRQIDQGHATSFLIYDQDGSNCPIFIPARATEEEKAAAKLIAETLASASGRKESSFPILPEKVRRWSQRGIYVGATLEAKILTPIPSTSLIDRPVGWTVLPEAILVTAHDPEDVQAAASYFLEQVIGARWFIPSPLGREVDHPIRLTLDLGDHICSPSFASRDFSGLSQAAEREWYRNNRLLALFEHGHTAQRIFTPEIFKLHPEIAPQLNGARAIPTGNDKSLWQPDFTKAATADVGVDTAMAAFRQNPKQPTFAIGQNDSIRFDQSPATIATLQPEQYFRGRPDYANLLFGYLNQVAARVGQEFPDRFITTYSYYWTENAPRLPVAANIVPFLTAERSGWFDPQFAAADRDLMRRWRGTGIRMFGMYDYFESKYLFIPNPTLYAVTEPIPFGFALGARAYFAEAHPNWGADGPKLWLTAQLLWDTQQDPARLIDEYYSRYWKEAAGPMRAYFELCEQQWLKQPMPAVWLKYFKEDQQRLLFTPAVMAELKAHLTHAKEAAISEVVRQRLRLVILAYNRTVAFCQHDLERETLHRLALNPSATPKQLEEAWNRYSHARAYLEELYQKPTLPNSLVTSPALIEEYLRDDPRGRIVWQLTQVGQSLTNLDQPSLKRLLHGAPPQSAQTMNSTSELLPDPQLASLHLRRGTHPFALLQWAQAGTTWNASGEPAEHRRIELRPNKNGGQSLFQEGCTFEEVYQLVPATPGTLYLGTAKINARISPGNLTFLFITPFDITGKLVGQVLLDRLPTGEWSEGTELKVLMRAPQGASYIGLGVGTQTQLPGDFAEYSNLSLKQVR